MQTVEQLFAGYQQEAFRLELLPEYKVSGEWEDFVEYKKSGIIKQNPDLIDYLNAAQAKIDAGKRHIRTRIIPSPITEYVIFEAKIGYIPQSKVGFELNFLEKIDYDNVLKTNFSNIEFSDFWLFDKQHLVVMKYDSEGKFLSAEVNTDQDLINNCIRLRNLLPEHSHSLSYFIDKYSIT